MTKQHIFLPIFVMVLLTGTMILVVPTYAAGPSGGGGNFFSGLVQFFEQRFGLSQTQVTTALNDYKTQRQATITPRPTPSAADMSAREKMRLDTLVTQGKITSDQENAIIAELATVHAEYNLADTSLTVDQRRQEMQQMQADLKAWATANNINMMYVGGFGMGGGPRGGMGGHRGNWGPKPSTTGTPTQQ